MTQRIPSPASSPRIGTVRRAPVPRERAGHGALPSIQGGQWARCAVAIIDRLKDQPNAGFRVKVRTP